MKGTMWCRLGYVCCALAGCLAGVGLFALLGTDEIKPNTVTKDNTLVRKVEDSVFFAEEGEEQVKVAPLGLSDRSSEESDTQTAEPPVAPGREVSQPGSAVTPGISRIPEPIKSPLEPREEPQKTETPRVDMPFGNEGKLPSLADQWANAQATVPAPFPGVALSEPESVEEQPSAEVITYPARIFGQTPVINRTDTYVSYFEFAYDLIAMLEPEVEARGINMNTLLTKFALKAFLCGVDIEKLDINAPIPRRLAALCLWLAAQVLNESGCDTSAKSAGGYVTDISKCSKAEKKAIAYLYEQGIVKGYQIAGQQFFPDAGLKTGIGTEWLSGVKRCWK